MSRPIHIPLARPMIGADEQAAAAAVLASGAIAQGPEVAHFESEFSSLVGGRPCVAVNSGTSALIVSLLSLGIGPGDEVIVPSFTFAATANAVVICGASPIFVDIDPDTFCMDPAAAAAAISGRTAALMPVHLYGHPADSDALVALAERHGLALIEDAAQAHGATAGGAPVGSLGDAAAFSFYATKNMTTGEGGMAVFDDPAAARRARLLRNQGMERQYENEIAGFNLRMTDIAAAIGRVQLRRLEDLTEARRTNAARLSTALTDPSLVGPIERPGTRHVFHQFTVRSKDRASVARELGEAGIETKVFYPKPVHRLPAFDVEVDLPQTQRAADEVLSLPVGPHLSADQIDYVAARLAERST